MLGDVLFEIMNILHDDGTIFLAISNGLLMTEAKAKLFSRYRYKWFQVSIDGANPEHHDEFRQKRGSWDAAVKAVMIAHSVTPESLNEIDEICELAYELGTSGIILGEVMPSGRSYLNADVMLNHEQRNFLHEAITANSRKFTGRMSIQRSSSTKIQLLRGVNTPNTGAIIRPNGDIRLDCVAPSVIGNVITEDFCEVWNSKANKIWKRQEILEYVNSWEDFEEINHGLKNYFDADVRL